jgi:hypothetical protein
MKKLVLLLTLQCLVAVIVSAQPDTSIRYFPDRYKLDIPEEWKKPKMIDAITEILPQTFQEYIDSNKQFCLDCRAGYTLMLVFDRPVFNEDRTEYHFKAALVLFDSTGKERIELVLVATDEVFQSRVSVEYAPQPSVYRQNNVIREVIRGPDGRIVTIVDIPMTPPTLVNNIPNYTNEGASLYKIVGIAEARVYKIRDILKELKTKGVEKD